MVLWADENLQVAFSGSGEITDGAAYPQLALYREHKMCFVKDTF
jgi:hypothetical protein